MGTRSSPLAMAQARQVRRLLAAVDPEVPTAIVPITTSGDRWRGGLAALGGKGAFVAELDRALARGEVDVCVHCVKDVPGDVPRPDGFTWAAYPPRADPRDCLLVPATSNARSLAGLPPGARVGTSAVRRRAQLGRHHPHLRTEDLRGNITGRIARLDAGAYDAVVLAYAGLRRVGLAHRAVEILPTDVMCPAVGAGVLGLECRYSDDGTVELLRRLDDAETRVHVTAERAMLGVLGGHCNSPIAGHATTAPDGRIGLFGAVFTRDGAAWVDAHAWARPEHARELGADVAARLLRAGARAVIDGIPH
ncbi:hydroxymethylbilane synthase [Nocardiopsis trehalosi]|uniref:hydroxymethylbilane synthase n=1 Tax=Nocardiopsis trehalosi TaxID=109329 RepID=UPI0024805781|nr:hydroxymethylbilane synthase [Nocardiopsis trehalosi]